MEFETKTELVANEKVWLVTKRNKPKVKKYVTIFFIIHCKYNSH
jgi:hypothetical protein